jgi:hypothetical protein
MSTPGILADTIPASTYDTPASTCQLIIATVE